MDTANIEKFDPTTKELQSMVATSKSITELSDPLVIRDMRLSLKNARVSISKKGKELREEAIAYQKAVIGKEKELIGIIEPEEERLAGIEELAKKRKEKEDRAHLIPMRREEIDRNNLMVDVSDDDLCEMDTTQFQTFINEHVAEMNEAKRLELEAKEREVKEAEARIAREKELKEREEKAREEEKANAEKREKEAAEKAEKDKQEAIEAVRREEAQKAADAEKKRLTAIEEEKMKKAEEARKLAEETAQREADERYRKWLSDNGALPEVTGWIAMKDPYGKNEMVLYKEVSRYTLE